MGILRVTLLLPTLCLLAVFTVVNTAQARKYDDVIESKYIEFAVYRDFPPYSFLKDGKPAGIDVDIGKRIASDMGVEARWLWLTADENLDDDLRNAVWKGSVVDRKVADVMLRVPYDREYAYAQDGYGLPRNDMVVMSSPYHKESWKLVRDINKTRKVRNLAIFQYQPIGVEIDSLPDFFLVGTLQGRLRENVHHYPTVFAAISDLKAGKLSAVAGMRSQLEWGLPNRSENLDIDDDGLESLGRKSWDIGIAIKDSYRQLGYAVDGVIVTMVKNGDMEKIFSSYGVSYEQPSMYDVAAE
jgi:polar amino acid transport system substrate-binding protein